MGRAFKSKTGEYIPHPDDRNASARLRHRFYIAENKCEVCKHSSLRYTQNDNCIMCQRYKIELARLGEGAIIDWEGTIPEAIDTPENYAEVRRATLLIESDPTRYVLHYDPCLTHGHVRVSDRVKHDKCVECTKLDKPREQATLDGRDTYVSTSPCQGCQDITVRRTDDASCTACDYIPKSDSNVITPDAMLMRDTPDIVMSKDNARDMGFKVYRTGTTCKRGHTGWRYVSTGNCIDCIKA